VIDQTAEGSYREMRRWAQVDLTVQRAKKSGDPEAIAEAEIARLDMMESYLRTDDNSSVQDVLDRVSLNEFIAVWQAIGGDANVGEVPNTPSTSGSEGTAP